MRDEREGVRTSVTSCRRVSVACGAALWVCYWLCVPAMCETNNESVTSDECAARASEQRSGVSV